MKKEIKHNTHASKRQLQKNLKDTAKVTKQVQNWAESDENGPHAAQTSKSTWKTVFCFACSTKMNKKVKSNSKEISKIQDRRENTTDV
jgi:hypothetical protein